MNQAVETRKAMARELLNKWSDIGAHAIIIGGSVAKGWADDYSDIEIGMFWQTMPSREERKRITELSNGEQAYYSGADESRPFEGGFFGDSFYVDGLQIDICHCLSEAVSHFVDSVEGDLLVNGIQETLWNVQNGLLLKESKQLHEWRNKLVFPMSQRQKIVTSHLSALVSPDLNLYARRGDVAIYYGLVSGIQKRMAYLLFALNGVFCVGLKNMAASFKWLAIKPDACFSRFERCYTVSCLESMTIMEGLISEIIALVKQHMPEVRVEKRPPYLGHRRQPWIKY